MNRIHWPIGLVVLLAAVSELPAQYGGLTIDYRRSTRNSGLRVSFGRPFGYYAAGPSYGPGPFGPFPPPFSSSRFTEVVVITRPVLVARPVLPLIPLEPIEEPELPPMPQLRVVPPDELPDEPLPGRDAGIFRPLPPDNRERARQPVQLPQEEQPKREKEPPLPERKLPAPPLKLDPLEESKRQLDLGKEAFARGEYGRAAERFRQAVNLAPRNPQGHLLLAQAHIALSNVRRAFDALQEGLRLEPTWPKQPFRPSDLYADNIADHAEHLRLLEEILQATPDDPVVLFVVGYELWFDGRREEARDLLLRAAPLLPDPTVVDRFLEAIPNREVL